MKKLLNSLPFRLLAGVIIGILVGLVANETFMNIVVTAKQLLGELITFCVPLIVIGFIAPSITRLGKNASRMLMVALILAYVSSVGAALVSMVAGFNIIPHLSIVSTAEGLKELPEVIFELSIPQIMSVMSALVFSVLIGLAVTWTKADRTAELLEEFQKIVLEIVTRVIIPILPVFIACTFCALYDRTLPVDDSAVSDRRCIFWKESAGGCETLWSGLYYCCWNHVFCSNSCSCPSLCEKIFCIEKRYG